MIDPSVSAVSKDREVYVLSDLHIGDGSAKDNLVKHHRYELFGRLLDKIERCEGQIILLGDFLELWRHRLEDVLDRWHKLIDRLHQMGAVYVLGNHDAALREAHLQKMHPFFENICPPFIASIGHSRFKFMHGHEIDPIISGDWHRFSHILRRFVGVFEFRSDMSLVTCDRVSGFLTEIAEQILRIRDYLTRQVNNHVCPTLLGLSDERLTWIKRPIRTRNMLGRFYCDRTNGLYDIAIAGHTHKAGQFKGWYYNSGCWTQKVPSYLKITPEGAVEVFLWSEDGPCQSTTELLV